MDKPLGKPRVGILGLTLEFYEEASPGLRDDREAWVRSAILPALEVVADVSFTKAVCRREEIDEVLAGYEAAGVDALLVICLTYAPSQLSLPALKRTRLPIMLWNTQELFGVGKDYDGQLMSANHGVHGSQDLANVLLRSGVRFKYVTSHLRDANGAEANGLRPLADFFQAAAAVGGLRRLGLGLLGYPFPGMGDFAVDSTDLVDKFGCRMAQLPLSEYIGLAEAAPADEVAGLLTCYRDSFDVAEDVADEDLENTARAEWALREMLAQRHIQAFSYQFLAFGEDDRVVTVPFIAACRMMADGIGFGGEGDLIGATGTWLLNRLQSPASFSEVFTVDFEGNSLLMSHMGEANVDMARRDHKVRLLAKQKPLVPIRGRQLSLATTLEPGPATLAALTIGPQRRWRLIASRMQVEDFGPLPTMDVPHFKLAPLNTDIRDWLTAYAMAAGPHHNAICFGDARERIRAVAELLDVDYCEV